MEEVLTGFYRKILLATDGSQGALHAARHAIYLAGLADAELLVVSVVDSQSAFFADFYHQLTADLLQEQAKKAVEEVLCLAEDSGLNKVTGKVLNGSPRQTIISWALEEAADLIVLGSHGYSRLAYLLIGSVAEYVVRHAHCPVLVVRK